MKTCSFGSVRYVLAVRDAENKRLAVCSTPRSLVDLAGLLRSLFAQYVAAAVIDVVLPGWPADQTVDDQEILVSAQRAAENEPGAIVWYKVRDLRAIEKDIEVRAAAAAAQEGQQ